MAHTCGLSGPRYLFTTEALFGLNLLTWAYFRLWLFPIHVLFHGVAHHPQLGTAHHVALCGSMLVAILALDITWFRMFLRMLWRLLRSKDSYEGVEDAAREYT